MRPGDSPELADALCTVALHLTPAEYADALELADRNGVSVEEIVARIAREALIARFGGERRTAGNVLPFQRP
jgi:hypothetical protein